MSATHANRFLTVVSALWRAPLQAFVISAIVLSGFYFFKTPLAVDDESMDDDVDAIEESIDEKSDAVAAVDNEEIATHEDAPPAPPPWLEYRIRRGDTLKSVLQGIQADDTMRIFLITQNLKSERLLRVNDTVYFRKNTQGEIADLLYKTSPDYYLTAGRDASGALWVREDPPALTQVRKTVAGIIDTSLFDAAKLAQMPDKALDALIVVLEPQIDFFREQWPGDSFRAVYDIWVDEENTVVKMGTLYVAEYQRANPNRAPILMVIEPNSGGYYSESGESMQPAFLSAPLKYRRVSSRFSKNRFHPVLKIWRPHRGVDYAAPTGTPVQATADGVVSKRTKERGYGNVVFLKHPGSYTTVYAHLQKFAKGITRGAEVVQGQIVGYVGQTGLATGPHLHYEFRVNNKHKDPLTYPLPPQLPPLEGEALAAFKKHSRPLIDELEAIILPTQVGEGEGEA